MVLRDTFNIMLADYITIKSVKAKFFRYEEGRFRRMIFVLHKTLPENIKNQGWAAWNVAEIQSTASVFRGSSPEEALANTFRKLEESEHTYRSLRELCKKYVMQYKGRRLEDELPFLEPEEQFELWQSRRDGLPLAWWHDGSIMKIKEQLRKGK